MVKLKAIMLTEGESFSSEAIFELHDQLNSLIENKQYPEMGVMIAKDNLIMGTITEIELTRIDEKYAIVVEAEFKDEEIEPFLNETPFKRVQIFPESVDTSE